MIIPIVDLNDKIISYKDRSEIDYSKDIFRTASLWIMNDNGDILLAQRKYDKKIDPGKWAEAVGGTVEANETYLETIIRESKEELGIDINELNVKFGPKQLIKTPCQYFVQWYVVCVDKSLAEFKIQKEEVEQIAWISFDAIRTELKRDPEKYIKAMPDILKLIYDNHNTI